MTDRQIGDFTFVSCDSCLDSWESVNKYVVFKIVQGDTTLDLHGKTCSLDWSSYGGGLYYPFPFMKVSNAVFSSVTTFPIDKNGNKKAFFVLENVTMDHLELYPDDELLNWTVRGSTIVVYRRNSGTIQNAKIIAFNSEISEGSVGDLIQAKTFNFYDCLINAYLLTSITAALTAIFDNCSIYKDIELNSSSTFNITFTNNVMYNSAILYFSGHGSNQTFVNSVFTNNTITDGPRKFISSSVSWNLSSIGNYEYRNNIGTEKPDESIKLALRIPWYSYEATIPSGKKRYLHQKSNNSYSCSLHGIKIRDLFFSFGENTKNDILVRTDPTKTFSSYSTLLEYSNSGSFVNSDTYDKVAGAIGSYLYRKGQSATKEILDGTYTNEDVNVAHTGLSDGDLCDIVLLVDKVYFASATGEILK